MTILGNRKVAFAVAGALALFGGSVAAQASTITASTIGQDNTNTANFYTIAYAAGGGTSSPIASITFDLSGFSSNLGGSVYNAGFDFDGVSNYNNSTAPVCDGASTVCYSSFSVGGTYNYGPGSTVNQQLTLNFGSGVFTTGNTFIFAADTDFLGSGSGSDFNGVPLSVTLQNGQTYSGNFSAVPLADQPTSLLAISIPSVSQVPLPGAVWLFGTGLLALGRIGRRRKAA